MQPLAGMLSASASGRQRIARLETHVGAILMPADRDGRVMGVLGEQLRGPNQQVRPEHVFDGVQHARIVANA